MKKSKNFYLRVAPALAGCKGALEYGFFKLATGERPKNGISTKNVKTVRIQLSDKGSNLLNKLLEQQKDIKTRQQACRMALSLIDESPQYIKTIKNFKL
ncbi:MAG: hypothetical protein K8R67_03970 [Desulfobacteraceae bacterium]|nr:hypothetical protein [Desulfobacteraceae bacterium]